AEQALVVAGHHRAERLGIAGLGQPGEVAFVQARVVDGCGGARGHRYSPAADRNSWRSGPFWKAPVRCLVTMPTPGLLTPREAMQSWVATSATATPRGCSEASRAAPISVVRRSWICSRRLKASTSRASLEMPTTREEGR